MINKVFMHFVRLDRRPGDIHGVLVAKPTVLDSASSALCYVQERRNTEE